MKKCIAFIDYLKITVYNLTENKITDFTPAVDNRRICRIHSSPQKSHSVENDNSKKAWAEVSKWWQLLTELPETLTLSGVEHMVCVVLSQTVVRYQLGGYYIEGRDSQATWVV